MRRRGPFEDEAYRQIGERIRAMRHERKVTTHGLAEALGVAESTIHNAEIGQTCSVTLLMRLAEEWDCSIDDLVPVVTSAACERRVVKRTRLWRAS